MKTRPTADRVREALFSILLSRFDLSGARLLDLFAGTGAVGIEALSRGAEGVVFVERDRGACGVLESNLETCGFAGRGQILALPVDRALVDLGRRGARFDGVFVDPPYRRGLVQEVLGQIGRAGLLGAGGWLMAENHTDEDLADSFGAFRLTVTRHYGKTRLALYVTDATIGQVADA